MADKLKTFVDTTWTLSDVDTATNKLTLVDNGANTQAVVKDIQVNMSKAIKGTINIGNYAVSNELVTLTGSAIVDNNESMVFEIPVPFGIKISRSVPKTVYSQGHYANTATIIPGRIINIVHTPSVTTTTGTTLTEAGIMSKYETVLKVSSFSNTVPSSPIQALSATSVSSMSQLAWVYRHSDTMLYYFRYDNNINCILYVSTNNGATWGLLNNDRYGYKCINPSGRISWISGTIYRFVNSGATTVSGSIQLSGRITNNYQTNTYSHASECNGWHFWCPNNSYTTILCGYHKDKDIAVTISLNNAMLIDSSGGLCVSYNATEGKYFIMSWNSSSQYLHRIDTDIDALVADGTGTGTRLSIALGINHYQAQDTTTQWIAGTDDIIFRDTSDSAMITTLSSKAPYYTTPRLAINAIIGGVVNYGTELTWTGTGQKIDVYADHLDTEATIQVRATGVEITE